MRLELLPLVVSSCLAFGPPPRRVASPRLSTTEIHASISRRDFASGAALALFGIAAAPQATIAAAPERPSTPDSKKSAQQEGAAEDDADGPVFDLNLAFVAAGYGSLASTLLNGAAEGECDPCSLALRNDAAAYEQAPSLVVEARTPSVMSSTPSVSTSYILEEGVGGFVEENEVAEEKA